MEDINEKIRAEKVYYNAMTTSQFMSLGKAAVTHWLAYLEDERMRPRFEEAILQLENLEKIQQEVVESVWNELKENLVSIVSISVVLTKEKLDNLDKAKKTLDFFFPLG